LLRKFVEFDESQDFMLSHLGVITVSCKRIIYCPFLWIRRFEILFSSSAYVQQSSFIILLHDLFSKVLQKTKLVVPVVGSSLAVIPPEVRAMHIANWERTNLIIRWCLGESKFVLLGLWIIWLCLVVRLFPLDTMLTSATGRLAVWYVMWFSLFGYFYTDAQPQSRLLYFLDWKAIEGQEFRRVSVGPVHGKW